MRTCTLLVRFAVQLENCRRLRIPPTAFRTETLNPWPMHKQKVKVKVKGQGTKVRVETDMQTDGGCECITSRANEVW